MLGRLYHAAAVPQGVMEFGPPLIFGEQPRQAPAVTPPPTAVPQPFLGQPGAVEAPWVMDESGSTSMYDQVKNMLVTTAMTSEDFTELLVDAFLCVQDSETIAQFLTYDRETLATVMHEFIQAAQAVQGAAAP